MQRSTGYYCMVTAEEGLVADFHGGIGLQFRFTLIEVKTESYVEFIDLE